MSACLRVTHILGRFKEGSGAQRGRKTKYQYKQIADKEQKVLERREESWHAYVALWLCKH